jgi:chromosome segregation ATPase
MTQGEKIKDLEHRIELMNDGQSELVKQLEHFRNMASGYKGRNVQFQEEVKKLKEQVKHYKELDLEGNHLYEDKIKELEDAQREIQSLRNFRNDLAPIAKVKELEKSIENKNQFIEQLQKKVQELKIQLCDAESKNDSQKSIIEELEETVAEVSKPWWRRIFG